MKNSSLSDESINPILLNPKCRSTNLLIRHLHEKHKHAGTSLITTIFLDYYWTPKARQLIKTIIRSCYKCRRYQALPYKLPDMPSFPSNRVNVSSPFTHIGVDYLGPTHIKSNQETKKIWIMIITCLSTRAIYLDAIIDLSAITFINSIRRFVARRGKPNTVISDNGRCFVLSAKLLSNQKEALEIEQYFSNEQIKWTFIPDFSP